jgi:hypothetical protein
MSGGFYMAPDGRWTLGVLIGLPFACLAAVGLLVLGVLAIRAARRDTYDPAPIWCLGIGALVALCLFIPGMLWAYWPLDSQYHQYREVRGTVDHISSRLATRAGRTRSSSSSSSAHRSSSASMTRVRHSSNRVII